LDRNRRAAALGDQVAAVIPQQLDLSIGVTSHLRSVIRVVAYCYILKGQTG